MRKIMSLGMALILATAIGGGLAGCAGTRYTESTGERVDDTATTARVKLALKKDTRYAYPDVKVTTFKGTVQLSGFVNDPAQKARATELAKNIEGVKDVVNNITVKS